jgi:hypothetical protein
VEGWLLLIIFLAVATLIIGRIQYGLQRAHVREREALFMYELSTSLAGASTSEVANGILLQNFAEQGALAIERVQAGTGVATLVVPASGNGSQH